VIVAVGLTIAGAGTLLLLVAVLSRAFGKISKEAFMFLAIWFIAESAFGFIIAVVGAILCQAAKGG